MARKTERPARGTFSVIVAARRSGLLAERIRLTLDERPGAVCRPVHLVQRVSGTEFRLSERLTVIDVFDQLDESMLILGAPGAGKTTQLLDLAALLVERGLPGARIPVVFDLADWSRQRASRFPWLRLGDQQPRDFTEWLLDGLERRYRIPPAVSLVWLAEDRFTLLLDGLDEVREAIRDRCVAEINMLQERGVTSVVVCSREADYERLAARLALQGAVVIRPLARDEVATYLAAVSPPLAGVAAALHEDVDLWELLTTPLMLNVMVLAQASRTWQAMVEQDDLRVRRRLLFDAYVVEVLARRRIPEFGNPRRVVRAARTLAEASVRMDAGVQAVPLNVHTIGKVIPQPAADAMRLWLVPVTHIVGSVACSAMPLRSGLWLGVVTACVTGLLHLMFFRETPPERESTIKVGPLLGYGAACAVVAGGVSGALLLLAGRVPLPSGAAAATLVLATALLVAGFLRLAKEDGWPAPGVIPAVIGVGVFFAALVGWLGVNRSALEGAVVGFLSASNVVFFSGLLGKFGLVRRPDKPWVAGAGFRARRTLLRSGLLAIIGTPLLGAGSSTAPFWATFGGWTVGVLLVPLPAMIICARLLPSMTHFALAVAGEPDPWRHSFLHLATDRSLLVRTGSEYRFVHLLIRDHLRACDSVELGGAVHRRRAELTAAAPRGGQ